MGSLFGSGIMVMLLVFGIIIIFLYIASIIWAVKDAKARGANWTAALIISIIPFAGVLVYLLMRPPLLLIDKEEQELDITLKRRQLAKYGNCANCGQPVKDDYVACPKCGRKLREICSSCKKPLEFSWTTCPYCGSPAKKTDSSSSFANNEKKDTFKNDASKSHIKNNESSKSQSDKKPNQTEKKEKHKDNLDSIKPTHLSKK